MAPTAAEKEPMERDAEKDAVSDVEASHNESESSPATILGHGVDADEALKAYAELEVEGLSLEIDEATNRRLLRRIDWNLMPIMCLVYGLNYLDKTTISYASIMGIKTDIHLVGDQYDWLSSMFYFGYLAWEYVTNRLLQRLPVGKYSAFNVCMWGAVLACMGAVQNFGGALAVRFFLGVFEAAVTPGFALLTSQWYTKHEQGTRIGIWFSFNGWGQIVGGLLAYGIARGVDAHGSAIAAWRIIFLATGLFTAMLGVVFFWVVPDNQLNARWLSKHDRILAIERIRVNEQGVGNKHFKLYQLKEALTDPLVWMLFAYALVADIPNGGISNFFSQLIVSFGYTKEQSLLYGTPGGAVEVITLLAWAALVYYYPNKRLASSAFFLCLAIMGIILIVALPLSNSKGRLVGYYFTQASPAPFVCLLSFVATNIAGYTKKTTVAALYLIGYCAGNIIGPQTFRPQNAPRYVPAEIAILVCWALCLVDLAAIWVWCSRQNAKKRRLRERPGYVKLKNHEFLDLTDGENAEFVYVL